MPVRTEEDLGDETIVTNGGGKTIASGESTHQTTEQGKQGSKKSKVGLTIHTSEDASLEWLVKPLRRNSRAGWGEQGTGSPR